VAEPPTARMACVDLLEPATVRATATTWRRAGERERGGVPDPGRGAGDQRIWSARGGGMPKYQ